MELGASRWIKNTLLKSTKIFHYREFHSENFHFFVIFGPKSTLGLFQPWSPLAKAILGSWPGQRPSWTQKVEHLSRQMQKFLSFVNFTVCF